MKQRLVTFSVLSLFLLSACVTINIYFPAAEAEEAAEQIVDDILDNLPVNPSIIKKRDGAYVPVLQNKNQVSFSPLDLFFPSAHAAPNFSVSAPAVKRIQSRIKKRVSSLRPFLASGGIGFKNDGFVILKNKSKISLKDRKKAAQLVKNENKDRKSLYKTIARVNNHPEWEDDIRATFAKKWMKGAARGWWVQSASGAWSKK